LSRRWSRASWRPNEPRQLRHHPAWAAKARGKASQTKDSKSPSGDLGPAGEEKAAKALNARISTADAARDAKDAAPVVWNSRDDNTLGSRDETLERHRSNEIDTLREESIHRRSTRSSCRLGKSLPLVNSLGISGVNLTRASPNRGDGFISSVSQTLDKGGGVGLTAYNNEPGRMAGTRYQIQGYSMYPPPSAGSRGA
jgi:hypothetical protein